MARSGGGVDISLLGDKKLLKKFKTLEAKLQKKIMRKALRKAGKPILKDAKSIAPEGKTGQLKKSIKLRAIKGRKNIGVRIQTEDGMYQGDEFYGAFVELGTKRMAAKPYLRPALEKNRAASTQIIKDEVWAGLKSEASK